MAKVKRQQGDKFESHVNTRQDRNTFLTDGGHWSWDAGSGTVTWDANAVLRRGGLASDTITGPGSVAGLITEHDTLFAKVDRTTGGATLVAGSADLDQVALDDADYVSDDYIALAVRGADGRLYFRDGHIFSDGETKLFGAVRSATDRVDTTADGNALQTVGFDYTIGNNQLAVYVGGLLQVLGTDYVETTDSPGQITFQAGHVPSAGETITYIDVLGGQGPSGAGTTSLADAWSVGTDIDVTGGDPVLIRNSGSPSEEVFVIEDDSVTPTTKFSVTSGGEVLGARHRIPTDGGGGEWRVAPNDDNGEDLIVIYDDGSGTYQGFRLDSDGLMEWGHYTGSYPGGVWTGDGALRWSVFTGTLNSAAVTDIVTGITNILGVSFTVVNNGGASILWESNAPQVAARQFALTFNAGTIRVANTTAGGGNPGTDVDGEAYTLIVFHRG